MINDHSHRNSDLEVNLQVTYSNPLLAVKPSPGHITGSKPSSRLSLITSINRDSQPNKALLPLQSLESSSYHELKFMFKGSDIQITSILTTAFTTYIKETIL